MNTVKNIKGGRNSTSWCCLCFYYNGICQPGHVVKMCQWLLPLAVHQRYSLKFTDNLDSIDWHVWCQRMALQSTIANDREKEEIPKTTFCLNSARRDDVSKRNNT